MRKCHLFGLAGLIVMSGVYAGAQEADSAVAKVGSLPLGVSSVKANPDGSFKSLVVKIVTELDTSRGKPKAEKGARLEAVGKSMSDLSQWIKQNCDVVISPDGYPTLVTKGEGGKDAAGTAVTLKAPEGKEYKPAPGEVDKVASMLTRQLVILHSGVTEDGKQAVIIMGLSQDQLNRPGILKDVTAEEGESRQDRRERLRTEGPPRSLEDDAPRNPAELRASAPAAQPAEPKASGKLADYL